MRRQRQRIVVLAAVAAVLTTGLLAGTTGALAQEPNNLTMVSDPGDYIGQGRSYAYTGSDATFTPTTDGSLVRIAVITPGFGHWWYVNIAAPPGEPLVPGTYLNATRAPFRDPGEPGLDVYGDGRGCNTLTGSFTVSQIDVDAQGDVVAFAATFEQHCEGMTPALRGSIRYAPDAPDPSPTPLPTPSPTADPSPTPSPTLSPTPSPTAPPVTPSPTMAPTATPAPTPMTLAIAVNPTGSYRNNTSVATIGGTVTCSRAVTVTVAGTLTQNLKKGTASASFSATVPCPASGSAPWSASVASSSGKSFATGGATVSATASGRDPVTGAAVSASTGAPVTLSAAR